MKNLNFVRWDDKVVITSAFGNVTISEFNNACDDNDFSLDGNTTGHLMLLDDREGKAYMLNDYGVDVLQVLNDVGRFEAPLSTLDYSDFDHA